MFPMHLLFFGSSIGYFPLISLFVLYPIKIWIADIWTLPIIKESCWDRIFNTSPVFKILFDCYISINNSTN